MKLFNNLMSLHNDYLSTNNRTSNQERVLVSGFASANRPLMEPAAEHKCAPISRLTLAFLLRQARPNGFIQLVALATRLEEQRGHFAAHLSLAYAQPVCVSREAHVNVCSSGPYIGL